MSESLELPYVPPAPQPEIPAVNFYAQGAIGHGLTGLIFGAGCLFTAYLFLPQGSGPSSGASSAILFAGVMIGPIFFAAIAALLLFVGAANLWRRIKRPIALRIDPDGVEGFLVFSRRRIAWPELTRVSYQGQWTVLHAGRLKMYINPEQISSVEGYDAGALIHHFVQGMTRGPGH